MVGHIQGVCSKARKILGLLYSRYYQYSDSRSLLKLYISLVRPHLDYAAQVWDPHLQKDIKSLESVQKCALKICLDQGYDGLLELFSLPSMENHRLYLKLCHLFKIVRCLCFFPTGIVSPTTDLTHSTRSFILRQPFSQTNSFYHSYIPDSVRIWNNLPEDIVCASNFSSFSKSLKCFF